KAKVKPDARHGNPVYAAMVESVDDSVGRIMRKLDEAGIADRTVVIFTSDNGGINTKEPIPGAAMSNYPLRAGKGYLYEGGIREPLIIRFPEATSPGRVCEEPVSGADFYPTIIDLAGVESDPNHIVDGESLTPLLFETGGLSRKSIYWHYPHYCIHENPAPMMWNTPALGGRPGGVIRNGDFKLIEFYEDNHLELYDLRKDIGEERNLADAMPEKAKELHKLLRDWRESVGALMPVPNPDYTGEWKDEAVT
ncbi:MAG: sulfatase-like hydrolase/transferase, partial [Armatimonadota bacterium]|nr:sulfatase-like hydrolase/transferase [Armatimonadota bacterium]